MMVFLVEYWLPRLKVYVIRVYRYWFLRRYLIDLATVLRSTHFGFGAQAEKAKCTLSFLPVWHRRRPDVRNGQL